MNITFNTDGTATCLHTDDIPLQTLGTLKVRRASTIEFDEKDQEWVVRGKYGGAMFGRQPGGLPAMGAGQLGVSGVNKDNVQHVSRSTWDVLVELNQRRAKYGGKFNRTFGVSIQKFWDVTTGFDVIKFDEYLKTPDGKSTREWIVETKGEKAAKLIEMLL